jgi:hypothetical protein
VAFGRCDSSISSAIVGYHHARVGKFRIETQTTCRKTKRRDELAVDTPTSVQSPVSSSSPLSPSEPFVSATDKFGISPFSRNLTLPTSINASLSFVA